MPPLLHNLSVGSGIASDDLAGAIERQIERVTFGQVSGLRVTRAGPALALYGTCRTYHVRELAQNAALDLADGEVALTNMIRVG